MTIELRDRFFTLSAPGANADEIARYHAEVDAIDARGATALDGLVVHWHPTRHCKAIRFVEAERIDASVRGLFARPSEAAPHLAAVFVDPRELSFRTYENIVPLDRLFGALELELANRKKLADNAYSFAIRAPEATRAQLVGLDSLGLYVPPLNAVSRGGERFIFHSAQLAEALTAAVKQAMPKSLLGGFSHVNPVFRCNRFEPGDDNFHRHHDTPYFDAARQHVSRYTVLLYLTGGSADPALDIVGRAKLGAIDEFTAVIFDQQYEHEGAPYVDARKVFLRTELVFTDLKLGHDAAIAQLFSKACYLTGESVFAPELARHADAYYNQVAAAHWNGLASTPAPEPFVHKQFRGVHWIANGYDFWFAKLDDLSLAECAALTLLDYFNCKLGSDGFRSLCKTATIEVDDPAAIPAFLAAQQSKSACSVFDKSLLFPPPEQPDPTQCCPFHSSIFDATRHDEIVELYDQSQRFARAHIMPAPIMMLGEDVFLDPDKFVVDGDRIHVLGKEALAPVNFAACWNAGGRPSNYIDVAATVRVQQFLVPPILWKEVAGCYHLRFDFFRNSWMVAHREAKVPVPMIRNFDFEQGDYPDELTGDDADPWMYAVDPTTLTSTNVRTTVWWAQDEQVIRDVYAAVRECREDEEG